ncbi:Nicotinamide-nucleotide adenylyltransferase 1 [Daldinia childiae]|uniref:Nicotinamide-nucleotide adenylyltransferase 1 n=1 Tax=Daldinia childiae TaxID=326645 RepID=UPI001444FA5E|nr:Nicotinamide-nucleotide adenylyltransferase 1 [Daldinia childiae]KAF3061736.1 Nicotinamide-nucleotide adenylyltransferase 1 [Daldinia childiae]
MTDSAAAGPAPQAASTMTLENYRFPAHRLLRQQRTPDRTPLVLVACGSFSPITYLHLRMFEMANDYARINTQYEVVGGYLSPVSDAYKKAGLAEAQHRLRMCELAAEETSSWLMVDPWEAIQPEYTPTAKVLDHFEHEINHNLGGVLSEDGESRKPAKIMLLAGADLIGTMSTPGVWAEKDLAHILGNYGAMIVERSGTDIDEALGNLKQWEDNIHVLTQMIQNNVSSTKIRLFLKRDMSVQYLIPATVIQYIEQHKLYTDNDEAKSKGKEKQ